MEISSNLVAFSKNTNFTQKFFIEQTSDKYFKSLLSKYLYCAL